MVVYFPKEFPKNGNKEHTILRIKRVNILLDSLIEKERDFKDALFNIEKEILEDDKPNVWNIHKEENMERVLEVDFHKFGIAVSRRTGQKIEDITTFAFYASVLLLKEESVKK